MLTEMMGGYLEELEGHSLMPLDIPTISQLPGSRQLPVVPKTSKWTMDQKEKCLNRTYEFDDHGRMCDFIRELLDYEVSSGHYAKLLCEFPDVTVSVKTHDLDAVTELDRAYADQCDQIYEDVRHYGSGEIIEDVY